MPADLVVGKTRLGPDQVSLTGYADISFRAASTPFRKPVTNLAQTLTLYSLN